MALTSAEDRAILYGAMKEELTETFADAFATVPIPPNLPWPNALELFDTLCLIAAVDDNGDACITCDDLELALRVTRRRRERAQRRSNSK